MPAIENISREQTNLREYLDVLLKRKWLIAGIVIIGFIHSSLVTSHSSLYL